ncbi:MAG: alkaline phosphatase family protein [Verrucomicrobia bacterium]|nr:alkaline phosphatase family protein [Verrucomicrobiota bacterium]
MRRCLLLLLCLGWTAGWAGELPPPPPQVEHVVIFIIDGLRPDVALRADMPGLRSLMREGAFTFWARTTSVAITLPSCTSALTGVTPARHQVSWNRDQPAAQQGYPAVPTVLELATKAGRVTALVAGKSKFVALARPGTVTHVSIPKTTKCTDAEVAIEAERVIREARPALMCVHFPDGDAVGHAKGWGSPEQLAQYAGTDHELRRVLAALDHAGIRSSTVVLVTADHGGAGRTHGGEDPRSRSIPWIIAGPGVRPGYDLNLDAKLSVNTEDTAATACWLLGLKPTVELDGRPVTAAFASGVTSSAAPDPATVH